MFDLIFNTLYLATSMGLAIYAWRLSNQASKSLAKWDLELQQQQRDLEAERLMLESEGVL